MLAVMPPFDPDSSDAENASAHIAEMVRRAALRQAAPGPSTTARPEVTIAQPPEPMPAMSPPAQPRPLPVRPPMRQPSLRVLVAGGIAAAVLIAGGAALLSRPAGPEAATTSSAGAPTPTRARSAPAGYTVRVTDVITDCQNHSYGQAKRSFKLRDCVTATRSLATGQVSGRQTLFVTSRITMASVEAATSIKRTLDADGTGNLNDLLREGKKTFPGAPAKMSSSGYASVQKGTVVLVSEAGFVDGGPSSNNDPVLRAAAVQVAALDTTKG
jgi:hypothetical protein